MIRIRVRIGVVLLCRLFRELVELTERAECAIPLAEQALLPDGWARVQGICDWVHANVLSYDAGEGTYDLALLAYLQLPAEQRRTAVRRSFHSLRDGGTLLVVAHDSTNLTEGTGGPQDASVLYTAEDVLADLDGERFEVGRAERVAREVPPPDGDAEGSTRTAITPVRTAVMTTPRVASTMASISCGVTPARASAISATPGAS